MIARALARIACLTALAVLATIASPRAARAGEDAATKIAKQHFYQGEKLFALGRFDDALAEYEAAFDAKPLPAFLFNIGQCHRNLHDLDAAIFSYRKYLHDEPDAANRAEVEDLIRELEDEQAHERARADQRQTERARVAVRTSARANPALTARADDGHAPLYTRWWLWTGVAVVAGGTTAYLLTRDRGGVPGTDLGNVVFPK
jgi:tetratricopeptide (TPR) repeat protein